MTLAIPTAAFLSGRWLYRSGRVLPMQRLGVAMVPLGLLALGFVGATGWPATLALIVLGLGMGLQMPTTLITVQQSVPREHVGTVTALTAFFRLLGGAIGIAVLSSIVLLLLRDHLPAGVTSLDGEGLGRLLDAARAEHGGANDIAFRQVMRLAALVSLLSLWFVRWLPDLRLHDPAAAGSAAPVDL
jgi:MFS family permease